MHESVHGIPLEMKKFDQCPSAKDTAEFNDDYSVMVRRGSNGLALYTILTMSGILVFVSFMLMFQYEPPLEQEGESDLNLWNDICSPQRLTTVWAGLLTEQIEILQNLIHASLLGGAALVAAYRGDVVWLFFVRNCLFYFLLAAASFLIVDTDTVSGNVASWRWIVALFFCLIGFPGFILSERTCRSLRKLQARIFQMSTTTSSSLKESVDRDNRILPKYQARTVSQQNKANILFQGAVAVQILSVAYVVCTTVLAVMPLQCNDETLEADMNPHRHVEGVVPDHEGMSPTSLSPFQMRYSLGAHEAFLLALFMLASTFPLCPASVGGALLSSVWRLLIGCCSLVSLLATSSAMDSRTSMSLIFTLLEALCMVPILIASWQLTVEAGTFRTILGHPAGKVSGNTTKSTAAYAPVAAIDFDEHEDEDNMCNEIELGGSNDMNEDAGFHRLSVPTLRLISLSSRFSDRQRFGARLMWISSLCLLVGTTVENMLLLLTTPIGAHSTHEVYKWGMHLCAMYAFTTIMNVSSPQVYMKTRLLLCFACPAGSLIGLWQLWVLITSTPDFTDDPLALLVAALFVWRALSGIGQCLGLWALDTIEPEKGSLEQMDITTNGMVADDDMKLRDAISRGRFALFKLFLPAFVAYTATSALLSSCSEPMISPTVPARCGEMNMFMLVPNWPGLGLFFHFGGLLAIFASDGLTTTTTSYPPSIMIGALFALHVSLLIATHMVMELTHSNVLEFIESFGWQDWLRRITLGGWMLSSFYLSVCLQRVWKLKQPVNF